MDECVHVWRTTQVVLARDGAYVERECIHCHAQTVVGPDELAGLV